ncbi:MAG: molybdopterin-dependent oxidoreductase [Acidobacteriaceae bacterium]
MKKPNGTRMKSPVTDEAEYKRLKRREFLKLLPLAAAGVVFIPPWRDKLFEAGLAFTDKVNAAVFRPDHLAKVYSDAEVAPLERFPLNFYDVADPEVDLAAWRLKVDGLVKQPGDYALGDIAALPKYTQNVKHVCVEGWDVIGNFGGARIADFLNKVGADTSAKYLYVECADDYYESLDMQTALHPQSLLCYEMYGKPLERVHGAPLGIRAPTKIGYKQAKYLTSIRVTNVLQKRGYWEDQGYDWYYGL